MFRSLVNKIATWTAAARERRRIAVIRVGAMSACTTADDGEVLNETRVYPTTRQVSVGIEIRLPQGSPSGALWVQLELHRPDGQVLPGIQNGLTPLADGFRALVHFDIAAPLLLARPGTWRLQVILQNTGRIIGSLELHVFDAAAILADLKVEAAALAIVQGDRATLGGVVPADADSVAPLLRFKPQSLPIKCFSHSLLRVELIQKLGNSIVDMTETPFVAIPHVDGAWSCSSWACRLGAGGVDRDGEWSFRVTASGHVVADLAFTVVQPGQMREALDVTRFDLVGSGPRAEVVIIRGEVHQGRLCSVSPVVQFQTKFPSALVEFEVSMALFDDGQLVGEAVLNRPLVMDRPQADCAAWEFSLDEEPPRDERQLLFILLVDGQPKAKRLLIIEKAPPQPYSDAQGCLINRDLITGVDYEAEIEAILKQAKAC